MSLHTFSLLERDPELAAASEMIEAARGGDGAVLLIEGVAGIGKTRLVRAIRELARDCGATALAGGGSELERQSPFNVVRALFEPALAGMEADERDRLFSGAAAPTRRLLDSAEDHSEGAAETFDLVHGLAWLAANMARQAPLVLLVDDAQWLDSASGRFLAYLADRLEDMPIMLVVAFRPDDPAAPDALDRLAVKLDTTTLRPAPLSVDAIATLAGEALSAPPSQAFAEACHLATGGNPFAVRSLLVDLAADGVRPDDAGARGLAARLPADVERALRLRLESLPHNATRLARAVAVLGDGCGLRMAADLAGIGTDDAAETAELLARVDILVPGHGLGFTHPLARAAVYRRMPAMDRSRLHRDAAGLLAGAAAPERLAVHLLEVEPAGDSTVVETLRAAAREARSLGGRGEAIAFLRRALAEPPPPDGRFVTLVELGVAESQAWEMEPAGSNLRAALGLAPDPATRAEIAIMLAGTRRGMGDFTGAVAILESELAESGGTDAEIARILESALLQNAVQDAAAHSLLRDRPRPDPAGLEGSTRGERRLLMVLALEALTAGDPRDPGLALARRALADMPPIRDEPAGNTIVLFPIVGMIEAGAYAECADLLDWIVDDARDQGSLVGYATSAAFRSHARWLTGDLDGAEADALSAWSLLHETAGALGAAQALGALIDVLVGRGDLAGAEAELNQSGLADTPADQINLLVLAAARLRLRLAQHRWADALTEADRIGAAAEALGVLISGTVEHGPNRALALLGLGRRDDAVDAAAKEVERAERYGAEYAVSAALRAHGLALGGPEGASMLARAVAEAERGCARLHLARALLDHGAAMRRLGHKRDAREPLRRALDVASSCGAEAIAEEARAELLATGARPRRESLTGVESLTARERRVASLAAEGLSNPEIAQALFITRRTVEKHVGEVLRKLQLSSRTGIADALEPAAAP